MSTKRIIQTAFFAAIFLSAPLNASNDGKVKYEEPCDRPDEAPEKKERRKYLEHLTLMTMNEADRLYSLGRCDDAMNVYKRSIEKLEDADYEDFPELAASFHGGLGGTAKICSLLLLIDASQEYEKAARIYEESGLFTAASIHSILLAGSYEQLRDLENAEASYRRAIAVADLISGNSDGCSPYLSVLARKRLLAFYKTHGRNEEAAEIANELAQLRQCHPAIHEDETRELLKRQQRQMSPSAKEDADAGAVE